MKKSLAAAFLIVCGTILSAVEPGGSVYPDEMKKKLTPVTEAVTGPEKCPYTVILFFDARSADAMTSLQLLEELRLQYSSYPEARQPAILGISRNSRRITKNAIGRNNPGYAVYADESGNVFQEYAAQEILLPFALIAEKNKVLWKGSPIDIGSILTLLEKKQFDPSLQLKIETYRKEMQMAVQASLPDVVLRSAEDILKLQPGDTLAIRAKLFVLENTKRFPQALVFAKENAEKNPQDVNQTILYLEYIRRAGKPENFLPAFREAEKRFRNGPEALFRLMRYTAGNIPVNWTAPAESRKVLDSIRDYMNTQKPERLSQYLECSAGTYYALCDIKNAVAEQKKARDLRMGTPLEKETRRMLLFYQSLEQVK